MGDEDDGYSPVAQFPKRAEQLLHLLGNQHRGGFVEDEDLRSPEQHLGDFHSLFFPHREFFHQPVGIESALSGGFRDSPLGVPEVDLQAGTRLGAQNDVFQYRHLFSQHEMLVNHSDSGIDRVLGRHHGHRFASDADLALVGDQHPIQDLHQGGLSRAILPHHRMNIPFPHGQINPVVGYHARKTLGDLKQFDGNGTHPPDTTSKVAEW